jgi:hypothetical protein
MPPLLEPGSTLTVGFAQATHPHHHLNSAVFVCPLSPSPRGSRRLGGEVHEALAGGRGRRGALVHAAVYFSFDDAGLITRIEEYANFIPAGQDN